MEFVQLSAYDRLKLSEWLMSNRHLASRDN
jgi:hypothetical protein